MIIYGWRATQVANESIAESCPSCKNQNALQMFVFQRYAHIFWIPMFPIGKSGASQCGHCKQVLKSKQMPADVKLAYENVAAQAKIPYWTFAGLAIIAVLVIMEMMRH